jgi:transcriptional regulator with XRE-family HTH domain
MESTGSNTVSDLRKLQKFLDDAYRASYLDGHIKGSIAYQMLALREKEGRNQTQFGELIGKPQSVVSRLEDAEYGGVNVNTLIEIASRLGIGLLVRFCDFETLLAANISPEGLAVENINETIQRRLQPSLAQTAAYISAPTMATNEGITATWQTNPIPNQPLPTFPELETPSFATFIPTQVSPLWDHSI